MLVVARRDEIISFCAELLEVDEFTDYGPNGLQVPGREVVSKIATGVTANGEFLAGAVDSGADLAVVHHGLFFSEEPAALSEQMAARLRTLLTEQVSLAAYHLPLDAHREIGNNALLCGALELELDEQPFGEVKGRPIGVVGRAPEPIKPQELVGRVKEATGREPLVFDAGPPNVRSVGIVTGGASRAIAEAAGRGLDAFITGEPSEHVMGDARDAGIHFIAGGHYATETFGVKALGERIAEKFDIRHDFIDIPNPI